MLFLGFQVPTFKTAWADKKAYRFHSEVLIPVLVFFNPCSFTEEKWKKYKKRFTPTIFPKWLIRTRNPFPCFVYFFMELFPNVNLCRHDVSTSNHACIYLASPKQPYKNYSSACRWSHGSTIYHWIVQEKLLYRFSHNMHVKFIIMPPDLAWQVPRVLFGESYI